VTPTRSKTVDYHRDFGLIHRDGGHPHMRRFVMGLKLESRFTRLSITFLDKYSFVTFL
jgi:hypothetical protein